MPTEKRDIQSKARLFIPTSSERALVSSQRELNKGIEEVNDLKKELTEMIQQAKEANSK